MLAAALVTGACGTAYGTDSTTVAALDDAAADGGADAGSAAITDAASEDSAVSTAMTFCMSHRDDGGFVYCNDFELPTAAIAPFGFAQTSVPTSAHLDVLADGPRDAVLRSAVNATTAGTHDVSVQQPVFTGDAVPSLQVDLEMKIAVDNAAVVSLAALHFVGSICEASIGIGAFDGRTLGGTRTRDVPLKPYVPGEWQHVTIKLTQTTSSSTGYHELTTYGGMTLVDRDAHSSSGGSLAGCTTGSVEIGAFDDGTDPSSVQVLFDDVLVRTVP